MKPLPNPFTSPQAYAAKAARLALDGRFACHRCGTVYQGGYTVPVAEQTDGPSSLHCASGLVCDDCGTFAVLKHGTGATRDFTRDELAWVRTLPVWAEWSAELDRVARAICPND